MAHSRNQPKAGKVWQGRRVWEEGDQSGGDGGGGHTCRGYVGGWGMETLLTPSGLIGVRQEVPVHNVGGALTKVEETGEKGVGVGGYLTRT